MLDERPADVLAAYREFFDGAEPGGEERVLKLFHDVAGSVPAYREFLRDHEVDPDSIRSLADFRGLPLMTKDAYLRCHPLPRLCRDGRIDDSDMIAVSSGSACSSGTMKFSEVVKAMGYELEIAEGAVRVSMGWTTSEAEIDRFLKAWRKLSQSLLKVREIAA